VVVVRIWNVGFQSYSLDCWWVDVEIASLLDVVRETHVRLLVRKVTYILGLSMKRHTERFPMRRVAQEVNFILAPLEIPSGAAAKPMHAPNPAVQTATSNPQY
jgi:hypothetical protein